MILLKLMVNRKWVGDILSWLQHFLNACALLFQVSELETEFEKLAGERAVQTRFLRSQQELKEKMAVDGDEDCEEGEDGTFHHHVGHDMYHMAQFTIYIELQPYLWYGCSSI